MGHRTLSLGRVFRALFLDSEAFEALREDDNPFVEGLFLVVILGVVTAVLSWIGQTVAWASTPRLSAIKELVLPALQDQSWWAKVAADPQALAAFQRIYDTVWQIFPWWAGASGPATTALNILIWPIGLMASWLLYGLVAHLFASLLGGRGTLNQTLGVMALAYMPLVFRGLGFIPFLVIGGVIDTWQLLLRYKALRTVHHLSWRRAFWATLLPFAVYLLFWLLVGGAVALLAAFAGR